MSTDHDATLATDTRLLVLHALRLSGFAATERVARMAGLVEAAVSAELDRAAAAGQALHRDGRISGWMLTPDGKAAHAALLADELERTGARPAVERANTAFL